MIDRLCFLLLSFNTIFVYGQSNIETRITGVKFDDIGFSVKYDILDESDANLYKTKFMYISFVGDTTRSSSLSSKALSGDVGVNAFSGVKNKWFRWNRKELPDGFFSLKVIEVSSYYKDKKVDRLYIKQYRVNERLSDPTISTRKQNRLQRKVERINRRIARRIARRRR